MSNRVEELESQVAELQAAVDGLTEELVETRERLRQLESDEGVDNTRTPERRESATGVEVEHSEPETETDADPEPEPEPTPEADAESETEADTEDDDGSDGNDIIVA
ncbi:DUF7518 family protein [Haloplanus sp. C73]|uniref:DUF7518 family protein n=1 Tax=Haloplanus sp. C73 TaxID=3421641 RepID=UPI003EBA1FF0